MECCIFIVFIIIMIASGALSGKKTSSSGGGNESVNLDDIFNEVMKVSNKNSSSSNIGMNNSMSALPSVQPQPQPSRRRSNRPAPNRSLSTPNVSRQSLVTPTSHGSHNCEEVNYDQLGSLEGGTGSFNLGEPEPVVSYTQQPQIKIGREDLLKSFIMSEVLQRYDINRIYSRIPPIKNDD